MNHRDIWFVGLLALAYLYLDAAAPAVRRLAALEPHSLPPLDEDPDFQPFSFAVADACPRDLRHPINLRGDGAKWCLACDEAFYPMAI